MKTAGEVTFRLVPCGELSTAEKSGLFDLLTEHFEGVTAEQFSRDLREKNLAILLERDGALVGFSTLLAYTTVFENAPVNVVYSGDTIVTPDAWGSTALPRAWVAGVDALRANLPPGRCFWLLLTSGFRTYRFLPVFWREFFPRCDCVTPPHLQKLLDHLARERFGLQFHPSAGIVRFANPQKLRSGLRNIPGGRENDPHITFFLSRNPDHGEGDELVCLTEPSSENLTAAGRRMMSHAYATSRNDR